MQAWLQAPEATASGAFFASRFGASHSFDLTRTGIMLMPFRGASAAQAPAITQSSERPTTCTSRRWRYLMGYDVTWSSSAGAGEAER